MEYIDDLQQTVSIMITESCPLNCTYCYERHKSQSMMTVKKALEIVKQEITANLRKRRVAIEFFGGEPFVNFEVIKEVVEYIENHYSDNLPIMFATTNGVLVHGQIKSWLSKHKDTFICGLSLDGTRDMHNINRCNSFDSIDIDFFASTYPSQGVKMTISQETLPHLSDGVIFAHSKGFVVSCNLAYGIDWSKRENSGLLERELLKLIDFYIRNPAIKPCTILSGSINNLGYPNIANRAYCGAGNFMHAYDVNGDLYPCQFFMPVSVGKENAKRAGEINFYNIIPDELNDHDCLYCKLSPICPTCYGSNYAMTGNIYSKDKNICELTKITIKARAYFQAMQWNKGLLSLSQEEEQAFLRFVDIIQSIE